MDCNANKLDLFDVIPCWITVIPGTTGYDKCICCSQV